MLRHREVKVDLPGVTLLVGRTASTCILTLVEGAGAVLCWKEQGWGALEKMTKSWWRQTQSLPPIPKSGHYMPADVHLFCTQDLEGPHSQARPGSWHRETQGKRHFSNLLPPEAVSFQLSPQGLAEYLFLTWIPPHLFFVSSQPGCLRMVCALACRQCIGFVSSIGFIKIAVVNTHYKNIQKHRLVLWKKWIHSSPFPMSLYLSPNPTLCGGSGCEQAFSKI